jgi:hypothetical protein
METGLLIGVTALLNTQNTYSQPFSWMKAANALSFRVTGGSHVPMSVRLHTGFPDHGLLNLYL